MGAALAEASQAARDVFGEVDEALGQSLFKLMREGPEDELKLTENAQPAIMAHALAVFRALTREGGVALEKAAQFVAGHSLGEYSALCAAGSFDLATTAKLLKLRGQAMQAAVPVGVGAMAALLGADLELAQRIAAAAAEGEVCTVANDNDPSQVVHVRPQGRDRPRHRHRQGHGRQARGAAAGVGAVPLPADAARRRRHGRGAGQDGDRAAARAALRQCHRRGGRRSVRDRAAAGRAGDRHGPLARKHRQHGRGGRRGVRRAGRQGARPDGQAHRARRQGDQRRHDRGYRSALRRSSPDVRSYWNDRAGDGRFAAGSAARSPRRWPRRARGWRCRARTRPSSRRSPRSLAAIM